MHAVKLFLFLAALAGAASSAFAADQVLIQTSLGDITVQLDRAHAPVTVDNFERYVREGHYDGTVFYRVVPNFVIQAGSYEADNMFRPPHDPIMLEANNGLHNVRGAIAMARMDEPNTGTSEFYINLADNPGLDHLATDPGNATGYAVFGQVISGMDVADKIAAVPLGDSGPVPHAAPVAPIVIKKVTLLL
ncbi:MAG TPA: peptidylprolyl isomerase [Rhizomicrobium sp.]